MSYNQNELIFNNDPINGIHSGGFSVNSLMMKAGFSPITTINTNAANNLSNLNQDQTGGKVSDIFKDLVVPNWAFMNNMVGGRKEDVVDKNKYDGIHGIHGDNENDTDDDNTIDDDLHNKLLELVKHHEQTNKINKTNKPSKKTTRKHKVNSKKTNTKKNKKLSNIK